MWLVCLETHLSVKSLSHKVSEVISNEVYILTNTEIRGFSGGSVVKNLPLKARVTGDHVQSRDWEDPMQKEMAIHSSILA